MVPKTISGRIAALALVAVASTLSACGDEELLKATTERAQALKAVDVITARNTELTAEMQRAKDALAAERIRVAELSRELVTERARHHKTSVALANQVQRVKGAELVAGTAVKEAYLNGAQAEKKKAIKAEPKKKT